MLTERQQHLIDSLKPFGWGYAKFAESVENQGWCSQKQEDTMCHLYNKAVHLKRLARERYAKGAMKSYSWYDYDSDISDGEAMLSHEFF